jgi:hypothetical protein
MKVAKTPRYDIIGPFTDSGRSTVGSSALIALTQPSQPESVQFCTVAGILLVTEGRCRAGLILPSVV